MKASYSGLIMAYYAIATMLASSWPVREPVLKEKWTIPEEWQTKLYS